MSVAPGPSWAACPTACAELLGSGGAWGVVADSPCEPAGRVVRGMGGSFRFCSGNCHSRPRRRQDRLADCQPGHGGVSPSGPPSMLTACASRPGSDLPRRCVPWLYIRAHTTPPTPPTTPHPMPPPGPPGPDIAPPEINEPPPLEEPPPMREPPAAPPPMANDAAQRRHIRPIPASVRAL